ncbi:hypothetical protein [Cutibacterium phage PAVL34]|nr:hypothetical protein [Cutibacterium phage PAVL34]
MLAVVDAVSIVFWPVVVDVLLYLGGGVLGVE